MGLSSSVHKLFTRLAGAPGQFPCHPGDEEKEDKGSHQYLASMVKKIKSSSANMIGNELNFEVYSINKYLLST